MLVVETPEALKALIGQELGVGEWLEVSQEMIDRFGLLPAPLKHLFRVTELKLRALPLGVRRIEAGPMGGRLVFGPAPKICVCSISRSTNCCRFSRRSSATLQRCTANVSRP